jgi:hypothetical protein
MYWARWGDALKEAGFEPIVPQHKIPEDVICKKFCELSIKLKKKPTYSELKMAKRNDVDFPSSRIMVRHYGSISKLSERAIEYAKRDKEYSSAVDYLSTSDGVDRGESRLPTALGCVYLIKGGRRFKVGRTKDVESRIPELSYQSQTRLGTTA